MGTDLQKSLYDIADLVNDFQGDLIAKYQTYKTSQLSSLQHTK